MIHFPKGYDQDNHRHSLQQNHNRTGTRCKYLDKFQDEPNADFKGDFIKELGFQVFIRESAYEQRRNAGWHLDNPDPGRLDLFTDGSGPNRSQGVHQRAGWAVVLARGRRRARHFRSGTHTLADVPAGEKGDPNIPIVFELMAIAEALEGAVAYLRRSVQVGGELAAHTVVIFSDCHGAVWSVGNFILATRSIDPTRQRKKGEWLNERILVSGYALRQLGVRYCRLELVKGHKGISPNEGADLVAKAEAGHVSWAEVRSSEYGPICLPFHAYAVQ